MAGQRAVVGKDPGTVAKGVNVAVIDRTDGGSAHVRHHEARGRLGRFGGETAVGERRLCRPHDLQSALGPASDTPAVGVAPPSPVTIALYLQCVLRRHQAAVDARRVSGEKSVESAHGEPPAAANARPLRVVA